jgi:branched-chain amino acid aminotransferase
MDYSFFSMKIDQLVTLNQKREGNVRFVYVAEENNGTWSISFIPHSYPSADDYFKGVKVGLLLAERDNPNAKVVQQSVRDRANQMIAEQSLYEVLLVDREGQITEGSRSNVFFVKDEVFYTAPASVVLVGITRQKVLECLQELNFRIVEDAVLASGIDQFGAAFLTGTSPKVLPVCSVDRQLFNPDFQCVRQLIKAYDEMIDRYLEQKRLNIHSF